MKNEFGHSYPTLQRIVPAVISIASLGVLGSFPSYSDSAGTNEIPKEREIHNTFSNDQKNGTILDATNPMQLLNRLREATAMEDATSPSDAIDEALRALDALQIEDPLKD